MKILSYRRFALWWQLAMNWFQGQFAAIAASIDFTPVEDKLDEVKGDVADVKTAVENIDFSTLAKDSTVAKQGTNPNATNTAILAAIPSVADLATEANATANKKAIMGDETETRTDSMLYTIWEEYGSANSWWLQDGSNGTIIKDDELGTLPNKGDIIKVNGYNDTNDAFVIVGLKDGVTIEDLCEYFESLTYGSHSSIAVPDLGDYAICAPLKNGIWRVKDAYMSNVSDLAVYIYEEYSLEGKSTKDVYYASKRLSEKLDEVKEVTAKETTAQEIKELVLQEGIILGNEYAETINEIIGDWSNE